MTARTSPVVAAAEEAPYYTPRLGDEQFAYPAIATVPMNRKLLDLEAQVGRVAALSEVLSNARHSDGVTSDALGWVELMLAEEIEALRVVMERGIAWGAPRAAGAA